jgi:hypothetical protein
MIQTENFSISKSKAIMSFGRGGQRYTYSNDVKKQWEDALSSNKILELIGSQNMPAYNYADVMNFLGTLSEKEKVLADKYRKFYRDLSRLLSTIPQSTDGVERDLAETLLDFRLISKYLDRPLRVLDIGPGAARHMTSLFLDNEKKPLLYAGIESIGLPYSFQNMAACLLEIQGRTPKVYDHIDYEFTWEAFPEIMNMEEGSIVHLPLWQEEKLPDNFFDLIICSYILDEIPQEDVPKITGIVGRCLKDDGIVYCRGSQQRSMLKDLYLYGCGDFHGLDITRSMMETGLRAISCNITASQMTRIFVKKGFEAFKSTEEPYIHYENDISLIPEMHKDYIRDQVENLVKSNKKVVVWGDMDSEYTQFRTYVEPFAEGLSILGLTHRIVEDKSNVLGLIQDKPERVIGLKPDVVIIASMRYKSILRQIREISDKDEYTLVRKFNYPVAFAYRKGL